MEFSIAAWQGWPKSGLEVPAEQLAVKFAPPMLRRRMSRLSKLVLALDKELNGESSGLPIVFASQHGELTRTTGLLRDIAAGELLSPTAFSLSVHNSSIGLRSLVDGERAAGTAIAAGNQTLAMGVIEAAMQLAAGAAGVLLVYADEAPPEEYRSMLGPESREQGLAMLLRPASHVDSDAMLVNVTRSEQVPRGAEPGELPRQHENLCAFLAGRGDEVALGDSNTIWKVGRID